MEGLTLIFRLFGARRRAQLAATLLLMLLGAVAEVVTIGATLPFLIVVTGQSGAAAARLPEWMHLLPRSFSGAVLLLIGAALGAGALRLLLLWMTQRFVAAAAHDIGTAMYSRVLNLPYAEFVRRNSSEIIASMDQLREVVSSVLQPMLQGVTGGVIALCIVGILFSIDPGAAIAAAAAVTAVYAAVSVATRGRLRRNSKIIADAAYARTKIIQEGVGGIRDIILDRSQEAFVGKFAEVDWRYRRSLANNSLIATGPRFVIEAAGVVALALIAAAMSLRPGGAAAAIPVLGALAIGAQRLLPLLQQVYSAWSSLAGNLQSVRNIAALLAERDEATATFGETEPLPFADRIDFASVGFRYPAGRFALREVELSVPRGARVGIVGTTGGGKSTLLDLLMGLLEPSEGEIRIDGRPLDARTRPAWQAQIAHVPQAIYLTDDSIAANIAFGAHSDRIDRTLVEAAARTAQLDGFVAELEHGYDTVVGERGVRLSGGQRQRIGIARALYRHAPVLILDEATSALDDETEAAVIRAIMTLGPDVTLFMIAHRRSTLAGCDRLLRVERGRVTEIDCL